MKYATHSIHSVVLIALAVLCSPTTVLPQVTGDGAVRETSALKLLPKLGTRCNPPNQRDGASVLVSPSQTYKAFDLAVAECHFTIGYDANTRVRWISTVDTAFETPDKIRVGDTLATVLAIAPDGVHTEIGWAWFVPLKSGWNAMISKPDTQDQTMRKLALDVPTAGELAPTDGYVSALFQREQVAGITTRSN